LIHPKRGHPSKSIWYFSRSGPLIVLPFPNILACLLTQISRVLLEKITIYQLLKKFPGFYISQKFINTFTSACQLSLSWASSNQSIPSNPTSWGLILLSSHLRLSHPVFLFPQVFPQTPVYTSPLPLRVTCQAYLIFLHFITRRLLSENRSLSSSLCSFLHSLVSSTLLGPNILLSTLFSNTLTLRSFLNLSDHVLQA